MKNGNIFKDGLAPETWTFGEAPSAHRYVGDLLLASRILCANCLLKLVTKVYAAPFDPQSVGQKVEWLDLRIRLYPDAGFRITPHLENYGYARGTTDKRFPTR